MDLFDHQSVKVTLGGGYIHTIQATHSITLGKNKLYVHKSK